MKRGRLKIDPDKVRAWQQRSRSNLPKKSDRKRASAAAEKVEREAVFARDGGCQMRPDDDRGRRFVWSEWLAGYNTGPCFGVLTAHHLLKASGGGKYERSNLVTLCAFHNGWVEDHPAEATRLGFVIRRLADDGS